VEKEMKSRCCNADTFRVKNKSLELEFDICKKCGLPWAVTLEEWVDIEGFEEKYKVSAIGEVRSKGRFENKNGERIYIEEKEVQHSETDDGYDKVTLQIGRRKYAPLVKTLVAESFIPNPKHYKYVSHISGNKKDDSYLNLKWIKTWRNSGKKQ